MMLGVQDDEQVGNGSSEMLPYNEAEASLSQSDVMELPNLDNQHLGHGDAYDNNHNNDTYEHQRFHTSPLLRFVPICFRFNNSSSEATGLSIDYYARGHLMMSSLFLGPALLVLSQQAVEMACTQDENEDNSTDSCTRIYGFRPSSLLSNVAILAGLLGSLSMPFVGAVVDYTPYRRQVAAISAVVLATIKLVEVMVGQNTWFLVAVLQVASSVLYNIHATAAYAYTSELTNDPDGQSKYNASYNIILYISMLAFLVQIVALSSIFGTDDVGTARISQVVTGTVSMVCFVFCWKYFFHDRPAQSQLPEGGSIWFCGFTKVYHTSQRIVGHYRAFTWIIAAMMFAEAAISSLTTIATTYLKEVLEMSANEIGLIFLNVLVLGIPGSYIGSYFSVRLKSPIKSALLCDALFIAVTSTASMVLTGPEHKGWTAHAFAALWGIGLGWLPPVDTTIFMNLMPTDSRAEFMGIMMLAAAILSWLPPLIFSILNENGAPMAWGLASLNLFFLFAMACLSQVGDFTKARLEATSDSTFAAVSANESLAVDNVDGSNEEQEMATTNHKLNKFGKVGLPAGGMNLQQHHQVV